MLDLDFCQFGQNVARKWPSRQSCGCISFWKGNMRKSVFGLNSGWCIGSDVSSGVHFWVEAFNLGIEYVSTMKTLYRECYRFTAKFQMNQSCY